MPTFIKTGFWEKTQKGFDHWLNLDLFVAQAVPTPNLQQVTDTGYITTTAITVAALNLTDVSAPALKGSLVYNNHILNFYNENSESITTVDSVNRINALGFASALNNTGQDVNAFGATAAQDNNANNVNAFGSVACATNQGNDVNGFGNGSAYNNVGSSLNALGNSAANINSGNYVNALGNNSAYNNTGNDVNAFGNTAAYNNAGDNVNAFGNGAGNDNLLSGQTIFSNASIPTYADRTAAALAITIFEGASPGCTYLYYDLSRNYISAIIT
jgi:hypothetical protein